MPRVVVVDRHRLFRSGVVTLLGGQGVEVAGEAASGDEALALVAQTHPDVVLMDLDLPDLPGGELIRRLAATGPDLGVVVLTAADAETDIIESMVAGASCYLLKDAPLDDILEALRAAARGHSLLSSVISETLVARIRDSVLPAPSLTTLSARELDVLRLLIEGAENREIAARLYMSESTVKHHVSSILRKLEVANRVQAVVRAIREDLV